MEDLTPIKRYQATEKGREAVKKAVAKYHATEKGRARVKEYKERNKEKLRDYYREYRAKKKNQNVPAVGIVN